MNHHATDNLTGHRNLALAVIGMALKDYAKAKPGSDARLETIHFLLDGPTLWHHLSGMDLDWISDVLRRVDAGELTYRPARGDTLAGDPI